MRFFQSLYASWMINNSSDWKAGLRKVLADLLELEVQVKVNWFGPSKNSQGRSLPNEFPHFYRLLRSKFLRYCGAYLVNQIPCNFVIAVVWSHFSFSATIKSSDRTEKAKVFDEANNIMKRWFQLAGTRLKKKLGND